MKDLSGFRVAVIASDGFEELELTEPIQALKKTHAEVTVISPKSGTIQGVNTMDKGKKVRVDKVLDEVSTEQFDGLVLPGGAFNADMLRMNEKLQSFLKKWQEASKPMAAICHAPWELVSAGLVKGRKLTSYHTIKDDIRNAGGNWIDESVVVEDNLVTSRQPSDLPVFIKEMLNLFSQHKASQQAVA